MMSDAEKQKLFDDCVNTLYETDDLAILKTPLKKLICFSIKSAIFNDMWVEKTWTIVNESYYL